MSQQTAEALQNLRSLYVCFKIVKFKTYQYLEYFFVQIVSFQYIFIYPEQFGTLVIIVVSVTQNRDVNDPLF